MPVVIRVVARADGGPTPEAGLFVKSFDVDANEGRGVARWATSPFRAMQFATPVDAFLYWKRQSLSVPRRPDGRPNRPLTAYTIELLKLDAAAANTMESCR